MKSQRTLTLMFDGFFIHSRGSVSLPLVGPGEYADIVSAIAGGVRPVFRDDLDAPVMASRPRAMSRAS